MPIRLGERQLPPGARRAGRRWRDSGSRRAGLKREAQRGARSGSGRRRWRRCGVGHATEAQSGQGQAAAQRDAVQQPALMDLHVIVPFGGGVPFDTACTSGTLVATNNIRTTTPSRLAHYEDNGNPL